MLSGLHDELIATGNITLAQNYWLFLQASDDNTGDNDEDELYDDDFDED